MELHDTYGIRLKQLFGLTEACGPGCFLAGEDVARKPGSAGNGCPFVDVRVVDERDNDLPAHEPGELILSGNNIMVKSLIFL